MIIPVPPGSIGGVQDTLILVLDAGFVVAIAVGSDEIVAAIIDNTGETYEYPWTLLAE